MSLKFIYTPDPVEVHEPGAIKLLCAGYQSHEAGIPEWLKNSADEYARRNTRSGDRVIVLLFRDRTKTRPGAIGCLDFGGMGSLAIQRFRVWADPDAAGDHEKFKDVQGGHGNGGKCYMTQMFTDYSFIHTVDNGIGCRYGVKGGSVAFGYVPDEESGKDFDVPDMIAELDAVLSEFDLTSKDLPKRARQALQHATGFTLVVGAGPRGYKTKIPVEKLLEELQSDPQMVNTLLACSVMAVVNGERWMKGKPLGLPTIEPIPTASTPIITEIPSKLVDPATGEHISTTDGGKLHRGKLVLRTSKAGMNYKTRRSRHSITFMSSSGFLGYIPVPELDIGSPYANHIFGECELDALQPYEANDRTRLAPSPLTRAVEEFVAKKIRELARDLERQARVKYGKKEKEELSEINAALDAWKNQFLAQVLGGSSGIGEPRLSQSLPSGVPDRIELSVAGRRMGRGVFTKPQLKFFDSNGRRIRPVPVRWIVDDPNVLVVDELGLVQSLTYGKASLRADLPDGSISSNEVIIEVVHIRSIRIEPEEIELPMGGRRKLDAVCLCEDGAELRDVLLIWYENDSSVARVSSSGMVFGVSLGETSVVAGDDGIQAEVEARIAVVQGEGGGSGKGKGRGFHRVLVSGIDRDPDTNKVVELTPGDPPIWQRPQDVDRNIWWINSAAPLAKLYRDESRGFGYKTREWRIYHVERYVDLISHILLMEEMKQQDVSPDLDVLYQERGQKMLDVQEKAVQQLTAFIDSGELPEV